MVLNIFRLVFDNQQKSKNTSGVTNILSMVENTLQCHSQVEDACFLNNGYL